MLIMRNSAGRSVRGHLVEILQTALAAQGVSPGKIDGVYGSGVARAVAAWQKVEGLPPTGEVDDLAWRTITGLHAPSLFDRILQLLAAYEGTGFGGAIGNFDGAYLTFGVIGFALRHELPELLADIEAEAPAEARKALGPRRWRRLLAASQGSAAQKRAFGDWLSTGAGKIRIRGAWRAGFQRLGDAAPVRRLQIERAFDRYYVNLALRDARRFNATTVREVGLFFDTAIQNGGVNARKRRLIDAALAAHPRTQGDARAKLIATAIADGSSRRWRRDVLKRRNVFATGQGVVHGANYIVEDWGLEQGPVDLKALRSDHVTWMPMEFAPPAAPRATPTAAPAVVTNINYLEEVPLDPSINGDLRSVNNRLMLASFGQPRGSYNQQCQPPSSPGFRALCAFGVKIDGFKWKVWGLKKAVASLKEVVADIKAEKPEIFDILDHLGMGCCRHQRGSRTAISNHSWGSAIDLTLNGVKDTRGNGVIQRGVLEIIPIWNRHLWYSGAVFRTEDAMHMEISRDWIEKHYPEIDRGGQIDNGVLDLGDRGPEVAEAQRLLQAKGYDIGRFGADGVFGDSTFNAVRAFQGAHGLGVDGRIGKKTWKKLRA